MKIIIEGCDGVGKTTLANKLAKVFNASVEHDKHPETYSNYMNRLQKPGNVIFDRFMIGQFVYNSSEERPMSYRELSDLIDYCKSRPDVVLIYVTLDKEVLLNRLLSRDKAEYEKDLEMMKKLGANSVEEYIEKVTSAYDMLVEDFAIVDGGDLVANLFNNDGSVE